MRLAHRSWGDETGDVALLLHGGGGSSREWIELGRWLAARGWHAIAVDLRGHGDSPADQASVAKPSLRVMADDLVETVGNIRPDATSVGLLVGSSLGAIVGLASVAAHPSFVDRLVLSEPAGRESTDRAQHAKEKRMLYDDPVGFFRRFYEGAEEVAAMSPEELDAFIKDKAAATSASDRAYRMARHEMISTVDVVELAEQCVVPTLVLLGRDKDTRLGQDSTVYDDMRHYSMLIAGATPLLRRSSPGTSPHPRIRSRRLSRNVRRIRRPTLGMACKHRIAAATVGARRLHSGWPDSRDVRE